MRILPNAMLIASFFLSTALAQNQDEYQRVNTCNIESDEARRLIEILKMAPENPIGIENMEEAPLTITEAKVKVAIRDKFSQPVSESIQNCKYVMDERITSVNNTNRRIKSVILRLTDYETRGVDLGARAIIEPFSSFVFGEREKSEIEYQSLPIDPTRFSVTVLEVKFEDGIVWERYPPEPEKIRVDTKPTPLRTPRAVYTEEARKNRIQGPVRMRLLVSTEGEVKQVRIISGLPDGLNDEAMCEAYNLRFHPAMKDGQRVEYRVLFEIDYLLQQKASR